MKSYGFDLFCRQCHQQDWTQLHSVVHNDTEAVAIIRCNSCHSEWSIVVLLRPMRDVDAAMRKRAQRSREREKASA